jgi:hypothetical protein
MHILRGENTRSNYAMLRRGGGGVDASDDKDDDGLDTRETGRLARRPRECTPSAPSDDGTSLRRCFATAAALLTPNEAGASEVPAREEVAGASTLTLCGPSTAAELGGLRCARRAFCAVRPRDTGPARFRCGTGGRRSRAWGFRLRGSLGLLSRQRVFRALFR